MTGIDGHRDSGPEALVIKMKAFQEFTRRQQSMEGDSEYGSY